jgi:hypothetical protein
MPLITEDMMSLEEDFISIAGSAMLVFTAVEVIRLVTAGAEAAVLLTGFTCTASDGGDGGGAVNFSFSFFPWTTCTTSTVAPPSRITWARMLRIRKLPLQFIQRCKRVRLI